MRSGVHDGDHGAAATQPTRRLHTEQPPAEHHHPGPGADGAQDLLAVGDRTKRHHAAGGDVLRRAQSRYRRKVRPTAGGQHQHVVVHKGLLAVRIRAPHLARVPVDTQHQGADARVDAVLLCPPRWLQPHRIGAEAAREHGGQQHSVVSRMWLGADHRGTDLSTVRVAPAQLVYQARAGHAVTHHDHSPAHWHTSSRTAHTLNSGMRLVGSSAGLVNRLARALPGK